MDAIACAIQGMMVMLVNGLDVLAQMVNQTKHAKYQMSNPVIVALTVSPDRQLVSAKQIAFAAMVCQILRVAAAELRQSVCIAMTVSC